MQMPFIGRKRRFSSHPAGSEQPQRIYHRNSQYAEHHSGRCFYRTNTFQIDIRFTKSNRHHSKQKSNHQSTGIPHKHLGTLSEQINQKERDKGSSQHPAHQSILDMSTIIKPNTEKNTIDHGHSRTQTIDSIDQIDRID